MGINSGFKGLNRICVFYVALRTSSKFCLTQH